MSRGWVDADDTEAVTVTVTARLPSVANDRSPINARMLKNNFGLFFAFFARLKDLVAARLPPARKLE